MDIVPDGSTGTTVTVNGTAAVITDGARRGANLFHSFSDFNLTDGQSAIFNGPNDVSNVINRITGSSPSLINGLLQSNIGAADFYFINPNGVTFGEAARIDVPAAFHVSTAESLQLADGSTVQTNAASNISMLASAEPVSFGFLGGQGDITFDGTRIRRVDGRVPSELTITAANVSLDGAQITTPRGELFDGMAFGVVALGQGANEVGIGTLETTSQALGNVEFNNETVINLINTTAQTSSATIRGGDVAFSGASRILLSNRHTSDVPFSVTNGDITIVASRLLADGSAAAPSDNVFSVIQQETRRNNNTGRIIVTADEMIVRGSEDRTAVVGSAVASGAGNGGDVVLNVGSLSLTDAAVAADTRGRGNAGSLIINASGDISLVRSNIASFSEFNDERAGSAGQILITGNGENTLTASQLSNINSRIRRGNGDETPSTIQILNFGSILLEDTDISASTIGEADAGRVVLEAFDSIVLTDTAIRSASERRPSSPEAIGAPGSIEIRGGGNTTLSIIDRDDALGRTPRIEANTQSTNANSAAANITITGFSQITSNGGSIETNTLAVADAGSITLSAADIMLDATTVRAQTTGVGNAGSVELRVPGILRIMGDGAEISSASTSTGLNAGEAGSVLLTGEGTGRLFITDGASVNATKNGGDGTEDPGNVRLIDFLEATITASAVTTSTNGAASAGEVVIDIPQLLLTDATIASRTTGAGAGGVISINTDELLMSGGEVTSEATATASGIAGNIDLSARRAFLSDGARLSTSTAGSGNAGRVDLTLTEALTLTDSGTLISSEALEGATGAAGAVRIDATGGTVDVLNGAQISTSSAQAGATGTGASVDIIANIIQIKGQAADGSASLVSSSATGDQGNAGAVTLTANVAALCDGGAVTTNAALGEAGDITFAIDNGGRLEIRGGAITTTAEAGTGSGGAIRIDEPIAVVIEGGVIEALGETAGANVRVNALYFLESTNPASRVDVNGDLVLDAQLGDITATAEPLEESFVSAGDLLRDACAIERQEGQTSQFVLGPEGLAQRPARMRTAVDWFQVYGGGDRD